MKVLLEFATPIGIFEIDKKFCENHLPIIKDILEKKKAVDLVIDLKGLPIIFMNMMNLKN